MRCVRIDMCGYVARRPGQINTCLDDVCPILAPPNRNTEMCAVGGVDVPALLSVEIMPETVYKTPKCKKNSGGLSKNQLLLGGHPDRARSLGELRNAGRALLSRVCKSTVHVSTT